MVSSISYIPIFFKLIRFSSEISFFNILSHFASIAKFSDKYADVPVLCALPVIIVIFIPVSSSFFLLCNISVFSFF